MKFCPTVISKSFYLALLIFFICLPSAQAQCTVQPQHIFFGVPGLSGLCGDSTQTLAIPTGPVPVTVTLTGGENVDPGYGTFNFTVFPVMENCVGGAFSPSMHIEFSAPVARASVRIQNGLYPGDVFTMVGSDGGSTNYTAGLGDVFDLTLVSSAGISSLDVSASNSTGFWSYAISLIDFQPLVNFVPTAGTLSVNPTSGIPGTSGVTVTGSDWVNPNLTAYQFSFDTTPLGQQVVASCLDQPFLTFDIPCEATIGTHQIICQLGGLSKSVAFTVSSPPIGVLTACQTGAKVTFKEKGQVLASPFRIGITVKKDKKLGRDKDHDRTRHLQAEVSGADPANVVLDVSDKNKLSLKQTGVSGNIIMFDLDGLPGSNPQMPGSDPNMPNGDVSIIATLTVNKVPSTIGTAPVVVIVPAKIATPHDTQTNAPTIIKNLVLNDDSQPPFAAVPDGKVILLTGYYKVLTITVWDQYGKPIGDLYSGAAITETLDTGDKHPINQNLSADGTYPDPVGSLRGKTGDPSDVDEFQKNSTEAKAWPNSTMRWPLANGINGGTQNIDVQVDGFQLNPGIVGRKLITSSLTKNISILWP